MARNIPSLLPARQEQQTKLLVFGTLNERQLRCYRKLPSSKVQYLSAGVVTRRRLPPVFRAQWTPSAASPDGQCWGRCVRLVLIPNFFPPKTKPTKWRHVRGSYIGIGHTSLDNLFSSPSHQFDKKKTTRNYSSQVFSALTSDCKK